MKYMVFVKMADDVGPAPQALFEVMGREMGALLASGVMVDAGGLGPGASATEVRLTEGRVSVTDGPFTEAKEVVGGYSIIDVGSREEAVAMARRVIEIHRDYWPGWEGSAEVRRLDEPQLEGGE